MLDRSFLLSQKIAVLCGGWSRERDISFRSGKRVLESLLRQGFSAVSIDPAAGDLLEALRREKSDVVFNLLHGRYGEDGVMQGFLEVNRIPYTGSQVLASAMGMNKIACKRLLQSVGLPTPRFCLSPSLDSWTMPVVVKPHAEGSSFGVTVVKERNKLEHVFRDTVTTYGNAFVEAYIAGQEVTIGVLGTGEKAEALPILELVPKREFYDYEAKYTPGMTEFILPARLEPTLYRKTQAVAVDVHRALGCRGWSRIDMMVSKDGVPYVHDVNTVPGMTELSDLPAQAAHAGISYDALVLKILSSAYETCEA